jgi:hypothetical protein
MNNPMFFLNTIKSCLGSKHQLTSSANQCLRHQPQQLISSGNQCLRHQLQQLTSSGNQCLRHQLQQLTSSANQCLRHQPQQLISSGNQCLRHQPKSSNNNVLKLSTKKLNLLSTTADSANQLSNSTYFL